jgi:hypothetical protein
LDPQIHLPDAHVVAAIGAFVSIRTTAPSTQQGALRITGTATGAVIGLLLTSWLIEDQVALSLVTHTNAFAFLFNGLIRSRTCFHLFQPCPVLHGSTKMPARCAV